MGTPVRRNWKNSSRIFHTTTNQSCKVQERNQSCKVQERQTNQPLFSCKVNQRCSRLLVPSSAKTETIGKSHDKNSNGDSYNMFCPFQYGGMSTTKTQDYSLQYTLSKNDKKNHT